VKYRLKHDHSKTLEVDEASAPKMSSWRHVSYRDTQLHSFGFDVPRVFLEETGWEPVPEKEPSIEAKLDECAADYDDCPTRDLMLSAAAVIRRLKENQTEKARHRLDVPCNEFCCLPEVNPSHYCTPIEAYQLLEVNRVEIETLKARLNAADSAIAQYERKVGEMTAQRDAALNDIAALWKK
jgi:hypothetical protein